MTRHWELKLSILRAAKSLRVDNWSNKEIVFLLNRLKYPEFYGEEGLIIFEDKWIPKFKKIGVTI